MTAPDMEARREVAAGGAATHSLSDSQAETLETFAQFFPPNPFKHGRVLGRDAKTGKKKVKTLEAQPVTLQTLKTHLGCGGKVAGNALGYLPGFTDTTNVGAIDLDGKDFPDGVDLAKDAVLATCAGLNVYAYPERSSSGKGWHVWVWAAEVVAYSVMRDALRAIAKRADMPKVETYPMGGDAKGRWIITPYFRALKGDGAALGKTYLETPEGQPIPVDELLDWVEVNPVATLESLAREMAAAPQPKPAPAAETSGEFLPEAIDVLLEVAGSHAPDQRHDALAAFLNLGRRAGDLGRMAKGLKAPEIFDLWCPDGTRTAQEWAEEIDRWAENVRDGTPESRRGIPYLKEAGFTIPKLPQPAAGSHRGLPEINASKRLRVVARQAVDALLEQNDPPRLFKRATELGRMLANADAPTFKPFDHVALKGEMERAIDFVKEGKEGEIVEARAPKDLAPDLLSRVDLLDFPELRMMATTPVYSPAGDLITEDGYHAASGVYLASNVAIPELPSVADAVALLRELLCDFPFVHRAGFAHAVSAMLLPAVRPMIDGPTPLYQIEASTQGTGKGLLSEVIPHVALGTDAGVMVQSKDGDEFEKRVTSMLLEGARVILLDNVHMLGGEALAAALTARTWRGRRLGKSEMLTLPNDALWLATGNNIALDADMPRRIIPIRLDTGVERPENRTGFKHPQLLRWIKENRGRLVAACFALVEAWKAAGQPAGKQRLGSYESWAEIMGGILEVAGIEGFLEGREHLYDLGNPEPAEWSRLLKAVHDAHGDKPIPAKDFLTEMRGMGTHADLWEGRRPLSQLQKVGRALLAQRDRVYGGRRIRIDGKKDGQTGSRLYRVEQLVSVPADGENGVTGVSNQVTPEKPRQENTDVGSVSGVSGVSGVFSELSTPNDREEW